MKQSLVAVWQAVNQVCSKRLKPFLPEFISRLELFGPLSVSEEARGKLISISASTIDRLLADVRRARGRGISTTRPGALIKQQIPVHTFADWNDVRPGFFEGDTVSHCGTFAHGSFLSTLVLTDIATTWTEGLALLSHDQQQVGSAVRQARDLLPFRLSSASDYGPKLSSTNPSEVEAHSRLRVGFQSGNCPVYPNESFFGLV